jgi:hypothetical protein
MKMTGIIIDKREKYETAPLEATWSEIHSHITVQFKNGKRHNFIFNDSGEAYRTTKIGEEVTATKKFGLYSNLKTNKIVFEHELYGKGFKITIGVLISQVVLAIVLTYYLLISSV